MPREVSQIAAGSGPNPFLFIVGCPKSATSLLQRVLNAHSLLAVTPEVEWITDYYKMRTGKNAWRPITPGLRDWRAQMPAGDVERFEAVAGDLLDELGYARLPAAVGRRPRPRRSPPRCLRRGHPVEGTSAATELQRVVGDLV